jgi:GTP-binding protein HflX
MTDDTRQGRQRRRLTATITDLEVARQRAYLVGVAFRGDDPQEAETSLEELGLLTETAGSDPVESSLVRRPAPVAATFIGSGKAAELKAATHALDIDVVVFDNELSPAQQRNLQKSFEVDVVDRVALILDIFAQHATSRAGMLQVELAQLRYRLPRLRGRGTEMSRLGGGIGTRGPGETQLETDRRRILGRIAKLERELTDLARSRETQRKTRRSAKIPMIALVGYTNAGKSTLFNRITGADVLVEDQLFATLDSTVRRLDLPTGHHLLLSDTVGFVRRLPHQLVEAFRSSLEEVIDADLLLHVVDASDAHPDRQIESVRAVLAEIGASAVPEVVVANKTDIADPVAVARLAELHGAVPASATTGNGIPDVLEAIVASLEERMTELELVIPYERGEIVAAIHRSGEVVEQEHLAEGTRIHVRMPNRSARDFDDFVA